MKYQEWFNYVHGKIKSGKPLLGAWITLPYPDVTEVLSNLPFDWFLIDMEHSPIDISQISPLLMSIKETNVVPITRVPWNDFVAIKRVLDLGVAGVLVPWVNSKEEAIKAVEAVRYPPLGIRGVGPRRCVKYGFENVVQYFNEWSKYAIVITQIETKKAYENLEEIISVDGVTGILIGPSDLSASLGMFGKANTPEFENILRDIATRAKPYEKIIGIFAPNPEFALKAYKLGYNFIALSHDITYLIEGAKKFLGMFQ
ncbi:MAG: aldolase/citrate lyase family protein [Desulfurococcaceae archaeon]